MSVADRQRRAVLHKRATIKTVVFYALVVGLWTYLSNMLLKWFIQDPQRLTQAQTVKGAPGSGRTFKVILPFPGQGTAEPDLPSTGTGPL